MSPDASIHAIRRSLGLGEREEAAVREAAPRLLPEVDRWVERFYERLLLDPLAVRMLTDEATVIRLRRSLGAWFHELFSLPFDETYERMRATIGAAHVRIGMPQHLMVAAMSGVRVDVAESVRRLFADDGEARDRALRALSLTLDLELALMLGAYRRRAREVDREAAWGLSAARVARRFARATRDAVDAALCWAELLRRAATEADRERFGVRLEEALKDVVRADRRTLAGLVEGGSAPVVVPVEDVLQRAIGDVSLPGRGAVTLDVEPKGLRLRLHPLPLALAVEEMVQRAAERDPHGTVRVRVRGDAGGGLSVEVTDAGSPPPRGAQPGPGVAIAEYVAELHAGAVEPFTPPGGGVGTRLRLGPAHEPAGDEDDEDPSDGPGRRPA